MNARERHTIVVGVGVVALALMVRGFVRGASMWQETKAALERSAHDLLVAETVRTRLVESRRSAPGLRPQEVNTAEKGLLATSRATALLRLSERVTADADSCELQLTSLAVERDDAGSAPLQSVRVRAHLMGSVRQLARFASATLQNAPIRTIDELTIRNSSPKAGANDAGDVAIEVVVRGWFTSVSQ